MGKDSDLILPEARVCLWTPKTVCKKSFAVCRTSFAAHDYDASVLSRSRYPEKR